MKNILLLFILFTSLVSWGQDYSQNLKVFTPENKDKNVHVFNIELPDDAYHLNVSINPDVIPDGMYVKYGNEEFWGGFVGKPFDESQKYEDLTIEEKKKFISIIQSKIGNPLKFNLNKINLDESKPYGGVIGEKYEVLLKDGQKIANIKKKKENQWSFKSAMNVPLIDNNTGRPFFNQKNYERAFYDALNIDPAKNRIIIQTAKETKKLDWGIFVTNNNPAKFYSEYFVGMNRLTRNFNGELVALKQEYNLLNTINVSIKSIGGNEVSSIFNDSDKTTEDIVKRIVDGSGNLNEFYSKSCGSLSGMNSFSFDKKEGVKQLTIIVFSPLYSENDSFEVSVNQSPEGMNYVYYESGQLSEKYPLLKGEYNGEKVTYYKNTSFNPSMNKDNNPWEGKIKTVYTFVNGQKTGIHKEYNKYEKLVLEEELKDGVRNGSYKSYKGDVIVEEGTYSNGLMTGEWIFRHDNGNLKGQGNYVNGDGGDKGESDISKNGRDGFWIFHHENGKKAQSLNYKNSQPEGEFLSYYTSGILKEKKYFVNGLLHGNYERFMDNGNLDLTGFYNMGQREGIWYRYGEVNWDGLILKTKYLETYEKNEVVKKEFECPEINTSLLELPSSLVEYDVNDVELINIFKSFSCLLMGDYFLKNENHEKAIYTYKDGLNHYYNPELLKRILPLGDYCFEQGHSGHVLDAYRNYLKRTSDVSRQNKYDKCKGKKCRIYE